MKLGTTHFSVKNAQSYLGQKAFPVQQGVRRADFINGISFKKTKEPFGIPKGSSIYHFPMGQDSEANLSFAEEQPHFKHLPSPIRAVGYQNLQLLQIDFLLPSSGSSASLKPDFAQL